MYRLLIVDDEWDVADGLYDLFRGLKTLELDVYKAYSGEEAMAVLDGRKIDIVMTDMRMPGMSGLKLLENVRARWPECPVIFLTGYGEFDIIYFATRQGNVEYMLKTESPEAIVGAVEAAARRLDERNSLARLTVLAQAQMEAWLPTMRRDCLRALLEGEAGCIETRAAQFTTLGIPLDAGKPVLLLAAMQLQPSGTEDFCRRELMFRAASADCFSAQVNWAIVSAGRNCMFWLLQPREEGPDWQRLRIQAKDSAEALQTTCADNLGLALAFAVDGSPASWDGLPAHAEALRQLLRFHMGKGKQQLILDGGAQEPGRSGYRAVFRKVKALEECLEEGRKAEFERLLSEVSHAVGEETASFFRALASETFAPHDADEATTAEAIVARVNRYILSHLGEDLSLVRLAGMVYFNPSYLSRVFKQVTGENVIERINGARVACARELLGTTRMKIKDISKKVGYESPSYFTQFFKRETGLSPQEHRDQCYKEEPSPK